MERSRQPRSSPRRSARRSKRRRFRCARRIRRGAGARSRGCFRARGLAIRPLRQ
ncbi:hypothetical protein [Mesorhizobium sp. M0590]|uniref:hypothetical protein n=1 Tax=Mesorhizobium sp. M0590 TaxID=2956966 RepID=UPI0033377377